MCVGNILNRFKTILDYRNFSKKDRKLRENLSEKKIDKMVEDSFPASDPPSTY